MRKRAATFVVPPYNEQLLPHEAYPPWRSLLHVVNLVAAALRRRAMPSNLKYLEVALAQASERIIAAAAGELPLERWHRRVRVAVDKLERARLSVVDYVVAETLDLSEAQAIVDGIDETIAKLIDQVALVPFPDEIRLCLPDLQVSRSVH